MKHDTHEMAFGLRVVELVWITFLGCALLMGTLNPWLLSTSDTLWAWLSRTLLLGFGALVAVEAVWLGVDFLRWQQRQGSRESKDGLRDSEHTHERAM